MAPERRNINRKLGKVTLLVGDHNTAFFLIIIIILNKTLQQHAVGPNEENQSSQQDQNKSHKCLRCYAFA